MAKRTPRGMAAVGAAATLVLLIATSAPGSASADDKVTGFGSTVLDDTLGTRLTTCQNTFSGHRTRDAASGQGSEISIDEISFSPCDPEQGISVTPNNLPWAMTLDSGTQLTLEGVDLNIINGQGTCRYTGTLDGARAFEGVYTIFGSLTRRSAGCDGPGRLGFSVLAESISMNETG